MPERLIEKDKSVILAADVGPEMLPDLVQAACTVEGVGGLKVGIVATLRQGLEQAVAIKDQIDIPVIYDHQKGGNDIPAMGSKFARECRLSGVDAVILFPFVSPVTEIDWIHACQDQDLNVIVGGHMTVPQFLQSEGGFIADDAPERIYRIAVDEGVRDFVVPGNKVEYVELYKALFDETLGDGNFSLYAPGFVTQRGEISKFAQVAGNKWHAIIGSAIYTSTTPREAAEVMTSKLE